VHFNWIYTNPTDQSQKARYIELEYELRPKIIRYLMERFESECDGDFSCFHFDVDMLTNMVSISPKTPPRFRLIALRDFDFFVNGEEDSRSVAF